MLYYDADDTKWWVIDAIDARDADRVTRLLANWPDLSVFDVAGYTLLHYAALKSSNAVISSVIAVAGLKALEACNELRHTPLMSAVSKGRTGAVGHLLELGADANGHCDGDNPLILAVEVGHVAIARLLLGAGADPHEKGYFGLNAVDYVLLPRFAQARDPQVNVELRALFNLE